MLLAGRPLRIRLAAFLTLAVVTIGGGVYVLGIALSDHVTFRRNDAAYFIVVTRKTVRDFPRFATVGQAVEFTYSARDGTAPGQIIMTYSSHDGLEDLDRKYQGYCGRQGYTRVPKDGHFLASRLACDASDYRIEVNFQQRKNATMVTVVFLEK